MTQPRTTRLPHAGFLAVLPLLSLPLACHTPAAAPPSEEADEAPVAAPVAAPVFIPVRDRFVRLDRGLHPLARPEFDHGRLDPARRIANLSMFFDLTPAQRRDRDALVAAQLDPKSPLYHQWLTPEQYRARFGASDELVSRGAAWLTGQGLEVHRTSRLGTRVTFSGTVAQLNAAFQTEMHEYVVGGVSHYAMATAPAIPPDLAGRVLGIHNTHDFYKTPVSRRRNAEARRLASPDFKFTFDAGADAGAAADTFDVLGPPDWATAYDVNRLYSPGIGGKMLDGTGVTIGIVGTAEIATSDVTAFRQLFGLGAPNLKMILVPDTGAAAAGRRGDGLEAILDVEWSGAIARNATVNYVYVGGSDRNVDDATFYLIEENLAGVMSESYGGCEQGSPASDADILEENGTAANLLGITYMASAGDSGAADCEGGEGGSPGLYVDMPGSFPGVTSVGGTEFPQPFWTGDGGLIAYPDETVWNESNDPYSAFGIGAGGGGVSSVFARPAYQASVGTCTPVGSLPVKEDASAMRQVPDLAVSAASGTPGYLIVCTISAEGDCAAGTVDGGLPDGGSPEGIPIGGTSAASPSFTGVVALLNEALGERLGNINPLLYALQATPTSSYGAPFHDITQGNNEVVCGAAAQGDAGGPTSGGWPSDAGCAPNGLYGYAAGPGYDCASGIGSIDAYDLVSALIGVTATTTTLTVSPTKTSETEPVTLTATVASKTANPAAPTGSVTFTFESFTTTGATDLSWELRTVEVGANGTATLSTLIPPGLVKPTDQFVDVVAVYGGDVKHLPSRSAKVGVAFDPIDFAVSPETVTIKPSTDQTFTASGGVAPVQWFIDEDTTSGRADGGFGFANITLDGGVLTAGPKSGYIAISALDKNGAEAIAYVTVGAPTTGAPWSPDAGPFVDAAVPPLFVDAGVQDAAKDAPVDAPVDARVDANDGGGGPLEVSSGGCRCSVGVGTGGGGSAPAGFAGLALGLGFVVRRRRRG